MKKQLNFIIKAFLISILLFSSYGNADRAKNISNSKTEIPKELLNKISKKCGKTPEPLKVKRWKQDENNKNAFVQYDGIISGIQFSFIRDELAHNLWKEFYDDINGYGYYLYLKNLAFDKNWNVYYDIAITKIKDQFSLIKFVNTSAPNYDLENADIILKLKEWNTKVPFKIVIADEDRLEAMFIKMPQDMKKFCQDVYKFCPDVIDQGYGSIDEMINDFTSKKYFWMWWD